jgi:hypothetical protein
MPHSRQARAASESAGADSDAGQYETSRLFNIYHNNVFLRSMITIHHTHRLSQVTGNEVRGADYELELAFDVTETAAHGQG